jgi:hypothetical protein
MRQKELQECNDLELTPTTFLFQNSRITLRSQWTDFPKYSIAPDMILVYDANELVHIFPRRWFTNEQYTEFQTYLQAAIENPKA